MRHTEEVYRALFLENKNSDICMLSSRKALCLCHKEYGPPEEVVYLEEQILPPLQPQEVLVEVKAAAINPADLTMIQGKYGILPPLPSVIGYDGVGTVVEIGSEVSGLQVGQQVIAPGRLGKWCDAFIANANELIIIPST